MLITASTILPSFAYSTTDVKFDYDFYMKDLYEKSGIYIGVSNKTLSQLENEGKLKINFDYRMKRQRYSFIDGRKYDGWGMRHSEINRDLDRNGGVLKINRAAEMIFADYAVDNHLNKLTMIVRDDLEIRKQDYSHYSKTYRHWQNSSNPVENFWNADGVAIWYGSQSYKVKHNFTISFLKPDGSLYRGTAVLSVTDLDQPVEDFIIKKSEIKNDTIYTPVPRSSWILTATDFYSGGYNYVKFHGSRDDSSTYKSGFLLEPDLSDGYIEYAVETLDAYNNIWFNAPDKGGLRINKKIK